MHLSAHAHPTLSKKGPVLLLAGVLVTLLISGCIDPMEPPERDGDSPDDDPDSQGAVQEGGDASSGDPTDADEQETGQDDEDGQEDEGSEGDEDGNGTEDPGDGQQDQDGEEEGDGSDEDQEDGEGEGEQAPQWPEPDEATLRPGMRVYTGEQVQGADLYCTTNFLFRSDEGLLYIGTAAECVDVYDVGDEVPIRDLDTTGTLAYSGWWDGQTHDRTNGHNFALIALDGHELETHPAVYHFGGPAAIADPAGLAALDPVVWYGNSTRLPEGQSAGGEGYVCNVTADAAYVRPVGIVTTFDHGAGIMDASGNASGILTGVTVEDDTCGVAVRVEPLQDALGEAHARGMDVQLVPWTLLQDGLLPSVPP